MSTSWDYTTNYTSKRIGRYGATKKDGNPPNMIRGALFRGPSTDTRLFTFGGSTFLANVSDPDWMAPTSDQYSLWSYDTASLKWSQYEITNAVPRRPNWGAWTEAIEKGVAFVLNGMVDWGSSEVMYTLGEYVGGKLSNVTKVQTTYLGGMLVIDLKTQKPRNVSTDTLGPPRVAGGLAYTDSFGRTMDGALITFGGMIAKNERNNTWFNGQLVSGASSRGLDLADENSSISRPSILRTISTTKT